MLGKDLTSRLELQASPTLEREVRISFARDVVTYPPSSTGARTIMNFPFAELGTVQSVTPHVRQNTFSLGNPLPVSVRL